MKDLLTLAAAALIAFVLTGWFIWGMYKAWHGEPRVKK